MIVACCLAGSYKLANNGMNKKDHYLYDTWREMRSRCNNPNHRYYINYGGRGITICPEWEDFWVFLTDMGDRPDGLTLDRVNNELGYSAQNCKWSTRKEQTKNRRPTRPHCKPTAKGFVTRQSRHYAQIRLNGTMVHLGSFDCPLMAHLAYKDAVREKLSA